MKGVTIYRQSFRFRTPKGLHSIYISCAALAALGGLQSKSLEQTVCCEEETTKSQKVDVKLISQQSRHEEVLFGKSNFLHRILTNSLRISCLPLPRIIQPADNTFEWPALKRGLRQRLKDEESIKMLQQKAEDAVKSGDPNQIRKVLAAICEVAYGKGVTPQDRGVVEIGAGNGQWARALTEDFKQHKIQTASDKNPWTNREFVLAYDTMEELPLNPAIYHARTQPAHDYFYRNVRKGDEIKAFSPQNWESRARVLLLVFPPPGVMALSCVKQYTLYEENDTVIYVGEGRGGANGNADFFDFFENGDWALLHCLDLSSLSCSKGYEKLFVLKRIRKTTKQIEGAADDNNLNRVLEYKKS